MNRWLIVVALAVAAPAHAGVYKCVEGGKTVFSDQPCGKDAKAVAVRPASGVESQDGQTAAATNSAAQRQQDLSRRVDNDVKRRIANNEIDRLEQRISVARSEMEEELANLKNKKRYATNSLAGATWEQSISDEMVAVTAKYDSKIRGWQHEISELKAKRDAVK